MSYLELVGLAFAVFSFLLLVGYCVVKLVDSMD